VDSDEAVVLMLEVAVAAQQRLALLGLLLVALLHVLQLTVQLVANLYSNCSLTTGVNKQNICKATSMMYVKKSTLNVKNKRGRGWDLV
jgi:hypothetical protein